MSEVALALAFAAIWSLFSFWSCMIVHRLSSKGRIQSMHIVFIKKLLTTLWFDDDICRKWQAKPGTDSLLKMWYMGILLHFHPICDSNQVKLFFLSAKNRLPFSVNDGSKGINKRSGRSVLYDRTGLSTIRFLVKTGFKILRTVTEAKFRPL